MNILVFFRAMEVILGWLQQQMPNIVNDLWTVQLSIIGIAISVMSLLFASLVGKVETHRHISKNKEINNELMSIYLSNSIKTYQQLNSKIVAVFISSCILFLYSSMVKYVSHNAVVFWMGLADLLFTIFLIIWAVCVIMNVVGQYKKESE